MNKSRFQNQISYIEKTLPDIVCLQEYNTDEVDLVYQKQMQDLGYDVYFERRPPKKRAHLLGWIPHQGFKRFLKGSPNLGVSVWWKKELFSVIHNKSYPFDHKGVDPLNLFRDRGYVSVYLEHVPTTQIIHVVNTHMNIVSENDRLQQGDEVLNICGNIAPTFVVGDFNTRRSDERVLWRFRNDGFETFHVGPTMCKSNPYRDWFNKMVTRRNQTLDHIFFKGAFLVDRQIVDEIYSDHKGLYAKFQAPFIPHDKSSAAWWLSNYYYPLSCPPSKKNHRKA